MGYEGTRRFPSGRRWPPVPGAGTPDLAFAYPGVQIVHPRLFADPPEGAFSTNLMWNRAIAKGRLVGIRLEGCGFMSARRRRATKPKPISPGWRRRERRSRIFSPSRPARLLRRRLRKGLIARLGRERRFALSDCVVYLPTRRAARAFGEAFAGVLGGAALLPEFRALGDARGRVRFRRRRAWALPPAIAPSAASCCWPIWCGDGIAAPRRHTSSFAQAAALADSLAIVMDEVETRRRRSWRHGSWRRRHWRRIGSM